MFQCVHIRPAVFPISYGSARLLEELQSSDCDGHGSGTDPPGLVQPEVKPAAA